MPSQHETPIRKAQITAFGDPTNITIVSSTISQPPPSHIQVRPIYASFSTTDINMRLGCYPFQPSPPLSPGYSLIGKVVSVGPSCTNTLSPGTLVACMTVYDAQSTLINLPEKYLIPVPLSSYPNLSQSLEQATSLILDYTTAYGLLHHHHIILTPTTRLFVHGLSGAVGFALLTLARLHDVTVYGTASPRNHEFLRSRGAIPFSYSDKTWMVAMKEIGGAHAVFDPLGFESWDESYSILCPTEASILVGYGGNLRTLTDQSQQTTQFSVVLPTLKLLAHNLKFWSYKRTRFYYITRDDATFKEELEVLFGLLGKGEIEVPIKRVWELDEVREAHETVGGKGVEGCGSMVVRVNKQVEE